MFEAKKQVIDYYGNSIYHSDDNAVENKIIEDEVEDGSVSEEDLFFKS